MAFNYTKWGFIVGTAIALTGIVASLTNQEIRCGIGLDRCTAQNELVDVIVREENLQPLQGVKVFFTSKGAPEVVETDSNGYAQIKIPSRGDISVNLLKDGYQPKTFTINLKNNKENTRTYTLEKVNNKILSPPLPGNSPDNAPNNSPNPKNEKKESTKSFEHNGFKIDFMGCDREGKVNCKFSIVNLETENRIFYLYSRSRTFDSSGNEYNALQVWVSNNTQNSFGGFPAQSSLIQGVPVKAGVTFDLPTELDSLAVLEVNFDNRIFQFRDVKINR